MLPVGGGARRNPFLQACMAPRAQHCASFVGTEMLKLRPSPLDTHYQQGAGMDYTANFSL